MTHAEIRTTIAWALREMDRADQRLDQSETESIPSVAKMLKEDSSVAYRNAVITIKEAASTPRLNLLLS
jgi:vesicle coat complex subunit